MGFDLAIGLGELFFGGLEAGAAAAPEIGAGIAAEAAPEALGLGAEAAAGGLAAGAGSEVAASAAPFIAAGDIGGQIAAEGGLAAAAAPEAAAVGAEAAAPTVAEALGGAAEPAAAGAAIDTAAPQLAALTGEQLGGGVGGGATNALEFAPSAPSAGGLPTTTGLGGGAAGAPSGATAASEGATVSPASELATGPENINAALDKPPIGAQPQTSAANAFASQPTGPGTSPFQAPTTLPPTDVAAGGSEVGAGGTADMSAPDVAGPTAAPSAASALASATPAAPAASGGISSTVGSVLDSPITKAAELALPLGFLGYNMLKGPAPIPPYATAATNNAASQLAPLQAQASQNVPQFNATASKDLNLATNFEISPAQAASIDTWKQNQYNQLYQQIANQGNTDPTKTSEWVQGKNQIDQQALVQQTQMVNQLISTAFQAASAANAGVSTSSNVTTQLDSTLMQAAQLQVQQDQNFQNAIGSSMQAFGLLGALSGRFGKQTGATA